MPEINNEQFPANSHVAKGELVNVNSEKKVEKVIKGNVVQKKKSFGQKMARTFLEDDTKSVWSYLLYDVLIPAAKSTISDMISGGTEMLLFGTAKGRPARRDSNKSYVSYSSYYNKPAPQTSLRDNRNRARLNFDDIILETRWEAEEVLSHMVDLIENYGVASVADLYELVGIAGSFTDNKYGWTNLNSASVTRVRDGYLINLPNALPID